jgi:hypothetical protein
MIKKAWRDQVANAAATFAPDEAWVLAACFGQGTAGNLIRAFEKARLRSPNADAPRDDSDERRANASHVLRAARFGLVNWVDSAKSDIELAQGADLSATGKPMAASTKDRVLRGSLHTFRLISGEALSFSPICMQRVLDDLRVQLSLDVAELPEAMYATESAPAKSAERHLWLPDGSGIAFFASPDVLEALFLDTPDSDT